MLLVSGRGWLVLGFAACACLCVFVSLCLCVCLLCGAVSCLVSRVVARYFMFVVRHKSFVVDCPSLCCALLLCVAVCGCVVCGCVLAGEGVYASNLSPCVRSKRPFVYRYHAHMRYTCERGTGTHWDVLNVHKVFFFSVSHHTPHQHNTAHIHHKTTQGSTFIAHTTQHSTHIQETHMEHNTTHLTPNPHPTQQV